MSRSVTIPTVSPFLPETRTQPMLCLAISLATSAAVSDSFTVMTGRDMMSLTTTSSGSVSCTDKGSNGSDPTCIKSSCESEAVLRQNVISTQTLGTLQALSSAGSNLAVQTSKEVRPSRFALPPTSIVYWLRLGFGVLAGVVYNIVGFGQGGVILGTLALISVGIGIYAVSVILVKNILGYGPDDLKGPNKHVTLGMGSYVIWMIFTTILLNTVLNPRPS